MEVSVGIERIFTRPQGGGGQVEHQAVLVVVGAGVQGDRYYQARDGPGQNITFVEAEEIEAFAAEYQRPVELSATGRNVVSC